ncbi:hypothetical protein [Saccharothrix sp. HUAS TT1]|uniref:hypothetical protein n=1 Tax=unclassified Saccharothrix TaxID=2593673 RepID=UPI00345B82C7
MEPPLDAVALAHRRLLRAIAGLTDAQVAEPSPLPDLGPWPAYPARRQDLPDWHADGSRLPVSGRSR